MTEAVQDNSSAEATQAVDATITESQATETVLGAQAPAKQEVEAAPTHQEIADFVSQLPEGIRADKSLQKFKDIGSLAKSYVELNKAFGKRLDDMTPDEVATYYGKLGRPEDASGYEFDAGEFDPDLAKQVGDQLSQWAHEAGLSKEQAAKLYNSYLENVSEGLSLQDVNLNQLKADQVKELKQEFGAAFNQRIDLANKALREFGGDDLVAVLQENNLENNPVLVKAFADIGKLIAEDKPVGKQDTAKFGMTPNEAQSKIAELMADSAFMSRWKNPMDPGHKEAIKQIESLYKLKAGQA